MHDITDRAAGGASVQYRSYEIADFEFRDEGSNGFTFEGVASVVDTPYMVRDQWGEFSETIRAGAFNKTLRDSKADVALLVNHDTKGIPLATRGAGTLKLTADPHLRVTAELDPARPSVQDIRSAVSRGEMRQMSIGFSVPKARDQWSDDYAERTISEVNLSEASIVWKGASPTTTASIRSLVDLLGDFSELDEDEMQRALQPHGYKLVRVDAIDDVVAVRSGGLVVSDELLTLWNRRLSG
jgi:HK97 family phage prohead protease